MFSFVFKEREFETDCSETIWDELGEENEPNQNILCRFLKIYKLKD